MRHSLILLSVVAVTLVAVGTSFAGTFTLAGTETLGLQIYSATPMLKTPGGASVTGTITLSPTADLQPGMTSTFYLDSQAKLVSALPRPELSVDTTKLTDGLHELRMEVSDGARLAFSSGALPIHVLNNTTVNLLGQTKEEVPQINKVYRKIIMREVIWFNDREADLEKHAYFSHNRVYITLTDLLRHVGGSVIWGPTSSYVEVERNNVKMRFVPGSSTVYVNGKRESLGRATSRIDNRLFVPVRPVLALLGVGTDWNRVNGRAYVNVK
jgi:hypothetical protein